jgi:hypothetical protein
MQAKKLQPWNRKYSCLCSTLGVMTDRLPPHLNYLAPGDGGTSTRLRRARSSHVQGGRLGEATLPASSNGYGAFVQARDY